MNLDDFKTGCEVVQAIVIVGATIFTARWTYRTYAHRERIDELKTLKRTIEHYHFKLQLFCAQVRMTETPEMGEISEKLELAQMHNALMELSSINLYTRPEFRRQIQELVGKWIAGGRIEKMQRRKSGLIPEDEVARAWQQFESEYEEAKRLIDEEARRFV